MLWFKCTLKILKIETFEVFTVILKKNGKVLFYYAVMHPNDADGMANSEDPDQTAPIGAV